MTLTIDRIKELVPEFDSWYGANETEAILMMPGARTGKIVDKTVFQALLTTRAEVERLREVLRYVDGEEIVFEGRRVIIIAPETVDECKDILAKTELVL